MSGWVDLSEYVVPRWDHRIIRANLPRGTIDTYGFWANAEYWVLDADNEWVQELFGWARFSFYDEDKGLYVDCAVIAGSSRGTR